MAFLCTQDRRAELSGPQADDFPADRLPRTSCRFCGCTEEHPCQLTAVVDTNRNEYLLAAGEIVTDGLETYQTFCAWLLDDVCSAPPCVERAYQALSWVHIALYEEVA